MHVTLLPALSIGRSVGQLVSWSVTFYFSYEFISLASLLLPKWSSDLKYGPAHPHATGVAVYLALFLVKFQILYSIIILLVKEHQV